jgi:hypothetical protein
MDTVSFVEEHIIPYWPRAKKLLEIVSNEFMSNTMRDRLFFNIGPYLLGYSDEPSQYENKILFKLTNVDDGPLATIRVELPTTPPFTVHDDLSNIEFQTYTGSLVPSPWYKRINKQWVLSEEYHRIAREKNEALIAEKEALIAKKTAVMENIKAIGFAPPSENSSFPGGGVYREMNLNHLQYVKPLTSEQIAANLRVGGPQYHEAELRRKDPLSGLYIPYTPIKKVKGGYRRTRQQREQRNRNRKTKFRLTSKSYSRRR